MKELKKKKRKYNRKEKTLNELNVFNYIRVPNYRCHIKLGNEITSNSSCSIFALSNVVEAAAKDKERNNLQLNQIWKMMIQLGLAILMRSKRGKTANMKRMKEEEGYHYFGKARKNCRKAQDKRQKQEVQKEQAMEKQIPTA